MTPIAYTREREKERRIDEDAVIERPRGNDKRGPNRRPAGGGGEGGRRRRGRAYEPYEILIDIRVTDFTGHTPLRSSTGSRIPFEYPASSFLHSLSC